MERYICFATIYICMKDTPMRNRTGFLITLPGGLVGIVDHAREKTPRSRYIEMAIREKLIRDGIECDIS